MIDLFIFAAHRNSFVHQYDEEYLNIKKNRRPGRPASMREDLLRDMKSTLDTEYKNGFCKLYLRYFPKYLTNLC